MFKDLRVLRMFRGFYSNTNRKTMSQVTKITFFFFYLLPLALLSQTPWQSERVYFGPDSNLIYTRDTLGNSIPDFSYAGYQNSEVSIPDVPVVKEVAPVAGDNTDHIQSAIIELAKLPVDSISGFRGTLLLSAGEYEVKGYVRVYESGIVLRGVGDGADPAGNTILKATGNSPAARTVIVAGGGTSTSWKDKDEASVVDIISDTVYVGDRRFRVSDASYYNVGDNIIIYHPCSEQWLTAIDFGGTFSDPPWNINEQPIVYNRYITDINNDTITIDAPVYNHLIRELAQSYIYKYTRKGIKTNIGIENLRIDIETTGGDDELHAWNAIDLYQIEDAWVRNCTMLHFVVSGIRSSTASRITVENCRAVQPVSVIEGTKRYNFNVYTASQLILFKNCHASYGRHHFVSNGTSWTSGCVFLDCTSSFAYTTSEGHRRWSTGLLFDNCIELNGPISDARLLGLYNRGDWGTGHGWAAAHSVAWACDVAGGQLIVQQPPTAQNYAIGCFGYVTGASPPAPFPAPEGYIEGANLAGLEPRSLFIAQLDERLRKIAASLKDEKVATRPIASVLYQNYPNPFNPSTTIAYSLRQADKVNLTIYDINGREVVILVDEQQSVGIHRVSWKPEKQASGLYFYRLTTGNNSQVKKLMYLK